MENEHNNNAMKLQGKRIIITGASGGLGSEAMSQLKQKGAKVIGIDKKPPKAGNNQDILIADIRNVAEITKAMKEAIQRLGGLDILINNAGVLELQDPTDPPDRHVSEHVDVHLYGAMRVTSLALPALLESGGRVINVASLFAVVNAPFIYAYTSTKRGLSGYSDILRMQYRGRLKVATVYPGFMDTPIHDKAVAQGLSVERIITFYLGKRKLIALDEPVPKAARGLVRICRKRRIRNHGLTFMGGLSLRAAKLMPRFVDGFINWRIGKLVRKGALTIELNRDDTAPVTNGFSSEESPLAPA